VALAQGFPSCDGGTASSFIGSTTSIKPNKTQ